MVTGAGRIAGGVDLTGGGVLSGVAGQTLRIDGDVVMNATSATNVTLGAVSSTALFDVGGDLKLAGTLSVTDAGGFGSGVYRLFDYGGVLTGNTMTVSAIAGGATGQIQTATGNVNLVVDSDGGGGGGDDGEGDPELSIQFWNGASKTADGTIHGGAGTWTAGPQTNWTNSDGTQASAWGGAFAVFQNNPATVTVDTAAGAVSASGLQFIGKGWTVSGDALALAGADGATTIRVGDGTTAGAGMRATIDAALTGASTLVKSDHGTLVLTGANSYTGGTQVVAGTLIGNAGSIRGDIGNAGTVVFDQAADARFAGMIAGLGGTEGAMVKRGAGNLTLTGASTLDWTVKAGGLTADAGRFGGDVSIGRGASLTFEQYADAAYAGRLSGPGDFALSGSGTVTLTGDSSAFTGETTIKGGRLVVGTTAGGALGGSLTIGAGGTLGGTGTVGSAGSTLTIAADAVHAPGNSIGVQTIAGDYANRGTLRIEATATEADKLVVAGSVDITGASLDLVLSPADVSGWDMFGGPFTIIDQQGAGAVTGTFDPVTKNLLFVDSILDYAGGDGNDVTLQLQRNGLAFTGIGITRNQIATGTAIETLGSDDPVWRAIALTGDVESARASFDALSGEIHASVRTAMVEDSRFVRSAANDRLRAAFEGVGASGGAVMAYEDGKPAAAAANADGLAMWSQSFGSWEHWDGDGNAARLDRSIGGFLYGADAPVFGSWRFGAVAGYSRTSFETNARQSSGTSDNYHAGLYGGTVWGGLALRLGAAYTLHDVSTERSVGASGIDESLKGDYTAGTLQLSGELAHRLQAGNVALEPFANLAYVDLHTDGFTEKGGASALGVGAADSDAIFTTLGLRASTRFDLDGAGVTAKGMLGWRHVHGDATPDATMRFASGGDTFSIGGVPIARDTAVIEAGLDYALTPTATLGVSYGGQFGSGMSGQSVKADFNVRF